jgi:hypothetical protein
VHLTTAAAGVVFIGDGIEMSETPTDDPGKTKSPCRLSIILAQSASVAIVLRRGPTKWVQLMKWDTARDEFQPGQWFHGRVYDRRCDLSPDGSLFIYFASKFDGRTLADREYTYAWTAISKPPYVTALALWPKGDCWHGGGLFESDRRVWLNHKPPAKPHPQHRPRGLTVVPNPEAHGEDYPVWSRRMTRDGWVLLQTGEFRSSGYGWRTVQPEVWERADATAALRLRRQTDAISFTTAGGPYVESFRLVLQSGEELPVPGASWADWDQSGRLVFVREGKLYAARVEGTRFVERELIDLNGNEPTRVPPPAEATRWDW